MCKESQDICILLNLFLSRYTLQYSGISVYLLQQCVLTQCFTRLSYSFINWTEPLVQAFFPNKHIGVACGTVKWE